jgi:transposase, IS5 family
MVRGIKRARGSIVDATIISAPSSTKNAAGERDPDMCQTRKGDQWHFGMKAHIGVDGATKVIHAVVATAANVADSTVLPDLLHGDETRVWGDQAYRGQREAIRSAAPAAQDFTNRRCRHRGAVDEVKKSKNRTKRACGPRWSIHSWSSSGCSALPACGIAAWRRTRIGCS